MSLLNILMAVVAGIAVHAGIAHGAVGLSRRPRDRTNIAFAVAALAVAVGAIAVIAMYSAESAEEHAAIMKWLLFPSSVTWTVAVVWLVAEYTGVRPVRFLGGLTAGFAAMIVIDLVLPLGLLHDRVGHLHVSGTGGPHVMLGEGVSPHSLNLITTGLTVVAVGFLFYTLVKVYRRGERGKAAYLGTAVVLFALTLLVDTLTDYGVLANFYTSQLFFAGVMLVTSIALRRESLRGEAELRRYRTELESQVSARVEELDRANEQLAGEARVRRLAEDALRRRVADLDALRRLSQTLAERQDLGTTLQRATEQIAALFGACSATVHLAQDGQVVSEARGDEGSAAGAAAGLFPGAPLFREAVGRRAVVVADPARQALPPELAERLAATGARELLVAPMTARTATVGVLVVARDVGGPRFSDSETELAQTVADTLAAAVESDWLHQRETREAAVRERQHLARELHDAVTQTVYSASLIAEALPEVWERDPDEGRRTLGSLRQLVSGALAEMRTLLFELRPGALRSATLDGLLERLGVALSGQIQAPVEVTVDEEVAVPVDVKIALYRVAQEAFSNIAKYARARKVTAFLKADAAGAVLRVTDDGRGFDPSSVAPERMGLRIMRERLDQIGASVEVDSAPGRGTSIVVAWPREADGGPAAGEEGGRERLEAHSSDDRR